MFTQLKTKKPPDKAHKKPPDKDQENYSAQNLHHQMGVITEAQLAYLLNVKPQTLAVWRSDNTGPAYIKPTSKTVLYFRDDVQKWFSCKVVQTNRTLTGSE